jgi:hypothetical protein
MKIIKLIMALGIFICLFLPLSQCTRISNSYQKDVAQRNVAEGTSQSEATIGAQSEIPQEKEVDIHIMIDSFDDMVDGEKIPFYISFILPLLFCVSVVKKKWHILLLTLQTVNHFWLIYLTYIAVWFLWQPLWGGYLLTSFVAIYFLVTIFEWINLFRKKQMT